MPGKPKITMYDQPRTMYYRTTDSPRIRATVVFGETARSYLTSHPTRPLKIAKMDVFLCTEDQHKEYVWCSRNAYEIGRAVQRCIAPVVLRKIAHLVGYEEAPNAR